MSVQILERPPGTVPAAEHDAAGAAYAADVKTSIKKVTMPETCAWLNYWNRRPLPILQATHIRMAQSLKQVDRVRLDALAAFIAQDPMLMAHTLRQTNVRTYGSLASTVITLDGALLMLGMEGMLRRSLLLPTVETFLPNTPAQQDFYCRVLNAHFAARLARSLAIHRFEARDQEIFLAALFTQLPALLNAINPQPLDAEQLADPQLPIALLTQWNMAERFLPLWESPTSARATLFHASLRLASELQQGWWGEEIAQTIRQIASQLGVNESVIWRVARNGLLKQARARTLVEPPSGVKDESEVTPITTRPHTVWPAARWLPMLPGEWPKASQQADTQPTIAPSAAPPQAHRIPEKMQTDKRPPAGPLSCALADTPGTSPSAPPPSPSSPLGATTTLSLLPGDPLAHPLSALFEALRKQGEFQRIWLGEGDPVQNTLRTRTFYSTQEHDFMRAMHLDLSRAPMLAMLIRQETSFWVNAVNFASAREMFHHAAPLVHEGGFCLGGLRLPGGKAGLLFADLLGGTVTERHYLIFQKTCLGWRHSTPPAL